jgi:hypothetical protein
MFNFFTCPKQENGNIGQLQQRAINSWRGLSIEKQIVLIQETAIGKTVGGAPRADDIFRLARRARNKGFYVYSNADIVFDNSLVQAVGYVVSANVGKEWLLVGQTANENGTSRGAGAIDWAVFTQNAVDKDMPPFALGRIAWDNWLILQAIDRGVPVIDVSDIVKAIHLDHDYSHIAGGRDETRNGIDAQNNLEMAGGQRAHDGKITAAPYKLDAKGNLLASGSTVDIITPTIRGREKYLERCVQSVKAQRYHMELVNHIIQVDEKLGGRSKARNDAIRSGKGKYVAYCDDDDILFPQHIITLVNYMESTGAAACYSLAYAMPEDEEMRLNGPIGIEWNQEPYEDPLRGNWTPINCICHRRDVLDTVGYWDEELDVLEDWHMMIRLQRAFGMHRIERVTCAYSVRASATIQNPAFDEKKWAAAKRISEEFA